MTVAPALLRLGSGGAYAGWDTSGSLCWKAVGRRGIPKTCPSAQKFRNPCRGGFHSNFRKAGWWTPKPFCKPPPIRRCGSLMGAGPTAFVAKTKRSIRLPGTFRERGRCRRFPMLEKMGSFKMRRNCGRNLRESWQAARWNSTSAIADPASRPATICSQ